MMHSSRHPARPAPRLASLTRLAAVAAVAFALLTAGCETTGGGGLSPRSTEGRAARLAIEGEHAESARLYIGLAASATGAERDRLTMHAIEQWLDGGDIDRARNAHASIVQPRSGANAWLWGTNSAALSLYEGDADTALNVLEPLSRASLPQDRRLRVEALRADAWIQKDDPARAVELMMQREGWLDDRDDIEKNRQRLWQGLVLSRPQSLRAAAELTLDPVVKGWLTLGSLGASTGQQGIGWLNGVVRWRETHQAHPAMVIVEDLEVTDDMLQYPRQIALLLPLSGDAASAGKAIQNGFLGAYFATAGGLDDRQSVRVYDVSSEGGASAAYASAVADGAEFVVGPLLRRSVTELANDILVPVPVLTLNYLPENTLAPPGLYQFALSPEDEAVAAAQRAIADGHMRAVVLVPNNGWGRRVFNAFATAFESMGGAVLDNRRYTAGNPDHSNTIEDLMALSGSVRRYQRLRANIGGPLQFDPRRRQDAEFIFLAANAATGRLLKSQLKFHYSGDLPVYSTSSINGMDGRSNSDLNGVMFADSPWIIAPQPWIERLPDQFAKYWPEQRRLGRLHAMGYDAYNLVGSLFAARGGYMNEVDGASGRLYQDDDGRIHRKMAWAQFQRGDTVALPGPEPDLLDGPIRDISGEGERLAPEASDAEPWLEPLDDRSRLDL